LFIWLHVFLPGSANVEMLEGVEGKK